jgi:hypothetical protein
MMEIQNILLASLPGLITVLVAILLNNSRLTDLNGRLSDINVRLGEFRAHVDQRFDTVDMRFDRMQAEMNTRFDDSKEVWKSELHRVEEILDARLKHLEER